MTATITVREVNQHTSAVIERASRGEELVITRDGRPAAILSPYRPRDTYEQMIADGRIIPAVDRNAPFSPIDCGPIDIDAILAEDREGRD